MWPSGLRRVTRNHFSSGGAGSNPATVVFIERNDRRQREHRVKKKEGIRDTRNKEEDKKETQEQRGIEQHKHEVSKEVGI